MPLPDQGGTSWILLGKMKGIFPGRSSNPAWRYEQTCGRRGLYCSQELLLHALRGRRESRVRLAETGRGCISSWHTVLFKWQQIWLKTFITFPDSLLSPTKRSTPGRGDNEAADQGCQSGALILGAKNRTCYGFQPAALCLEVDYQRNSTSTERCFQAIRLAYTQGINSPEICHVDQSKWLPL